MTVGELITELRHYPADLEVSLFTFNVSGGTDGFWYDHPVDPESFEWCGNQLRITAEA